MSQESLDEMPRWVVDVVAAPSRDLYDWLDGLRRPPIPDISMVLEMLADWLAWSDDSVLIERVVGSLVTWTEDRWGTWIPEADEDVARIARAWIALCDLATQWPEADPLRAVLRDHLEDRMNYLGPLSIGPHLDPLGSYLAAIGTRQADRLLAPLWWSLLELPYSVPVRHITYGMLGLQQLRGEDASLRGRFDPIVAEGLRTAGEALLRASHENRLSLEVARRTFVRVARRTRAGYPNAAWWRPHLAPAAQGEPLQGWILDVFPELAREHEHETLPSSPAQASPKAVRRSPDISEWAARATALRAMLATDFNAHAQREAELLLNEQRSYAEKTGEAHPLVQSLCNFSAGVRATQPGIAVTWAKEANEWSPWNDHTWSTLLRATWAHEGPERSLRIGLEAVDRVPSSQNARRELGENLLALRCYSQAEESFRAEYDRFHDIRAAAAMGYLLLRQANLQGAAQWFSTALAISPSNSYAIRGMARTLRADYRADRAVDLVRQALAKASPRDRHHLWSEYVSVLRDAGLPDEYKQARDEARAQGLDIGYQALKEPTTDDGRLFLQADDPVLLRGQAKLLRRAATRGGARADEYRAGARGLIDSAARVVWDDRIVAEDVRLLTDVALFSAADERAQRGLKRAPASLPLWNALGQVGLGRARVEKRRFSEQQLDELRAPYRRLSEFNSATRPVRELGWIRSALSLTDGRAADEAARHALKALTDWTESPGGSESRDWWQARVQAVLLPTGRESAIQDVSATRGLAEAKAWLLDELEDEFVTLAAV